MATGDRDRSGELRISPRLLLVVQENEDADDYRVSYIRRLSDSILLASGEAKTEVKIGEVEPLYFDDSRAAVMCPENGTDAKGTVRPRFRVLGVRRLPTV